MQKHSFGGNFSVFFIAYDALLDESTMHSYLVRAPCAYLSFYERFFATYEQRCERGLRAFASLLTLLNAPCLLFIVKTGSFMVTSSAKTPLIMAK